MERVYMESWTLLEEWLTRSLSVVNRTVTRIVLVMILVVFLLSIGRIGFSQETFVNPLEKGNINKLSDDGKYFLKFGASIEFWTRFLQYNPNTYSPSGDKIDHDIDFVLRRLTMSTIIKLDRFVGYTSLGTGTQTYSSSMGPYTTSKPTLYFYDFWGSYEFIPDYLRLGYGLSLYRGISRYTSCSAARTLGADVPMLAAPDVLTTEQTARHLGLFVAGNINFLNYRLVFGKPFLVNSTNKPAFGVNKAADITNSNFTTEGYFSFQFLEKEISYLPFYSATYLGKRKIFNIGAGFYSHPKSTESTTLSGDTIKHNKFHFAVDVFFEYPVVSGGAFTFYGAFFKYDYGPNYFLNGGTANVLATATNPLSGLTEPNFGTGKAIANQIAWLFPKQFGKLGKIQIYYEGNYMFFDYLNDAAFHHNFGINYFVLGHNLKFTTQYEMRPYMKNNSFDSYKSLIVFKTQVFF